MEQQSFDRLNELARGHARLLASVARREGLSADDALDAVQETFVTYLGMKAARDAVDERTRGLLVALVRNVSRNMRRRHHRARPHLGIDDAELTSELPTVDELLELASSRSRVLGCVQGLDAVPRKVMTLRVLEDLSGVDVARELGLTPGYVAVLLHRAKREIVSCLERRGT